MDAYIATMDKIGDAIIAFIDPEMKFTGYTKVRKIIDRQSIEVDYIVCTNSPIYGIL